MSTNLRKNLNIDDMKDSNKNEFDDGSEWILFKSLTHANLTSV